MKKDTLRKLYTHVLIQSTIEELEAGLENKEFVRKHKQKASMFLEENMKILSMDLGSATAAQEVIELSAWLRQMFEMMIKLGEQHGNRRNSFQKGFDELVKKHNLDK